MRRWIVTVPDKLPNIAHSPDGHPEPGVADIHIPNDIGLRQGLPRAPLMGLREIVSGLGLGNTCASLIPANATLLDNSAAAMRHCGVWVLFMTESAPPHGSSPASDR